MKIFLILLRNFNSSFNLGVKKMCKITAIKNPTKEIETHIGRIIIVKNITRNNLIIIFIEANIRNIFVNVTIFLSILF